MTSSSLNENISKAVGRYSSLFTLPSQKKIVVFLFFSCLCSGVVAVYPFKSSIHGLMLSVSLGIAFFILIVLVDFATFYSSMKKDAVFNLRRFSAVSLVSVSILLIFILLGSLISLLLGDKRIWVKLFLLGSCATLILRLLVFSTVSFADRLEVIFSSFLQPCMYNIILYFWNTTTETTFFPRYLAFFLFCIPFTLLITSLFVVLVNRVGKKKIGIPSLILLRAFLANWTEDLHAPLEFLLEQLGHEHEIKISLLVFRTKEKIKMAMLIPSFHPGPFKNVGSSALPYMIQTAIENKLRCVAAIPHGLSGHELNLTSQLQNQKVIAGVLDSLSFSNFSSEATPLVRTEIKDAKASCQIFGKCVLVTLTMAPHTMEDLPRDLDSIIDNEAKKKGVNCAAVVDAHNSIEGPFESMMVLTPLKKAAVTCIREAVRCQRFPFEVGAAKIVPQNISVKEGMGPGGISILVLKVKDQKTAYVTIDGNNMISGLRERILSTLRELDISNGEVFTTDTHAVNGVVLNKRGYHPIGEAIDQKKLLDYIKQTALTALDDLEPSEAAWCTSVIPDIKIMGAKQIETLCIIAEETAKLSKKLGVFLFAGAGILLGSVLMFL